MQTRSEGRFRIRQNMENAMHFKKADSLPEDGMLIKDILEEFYNPESETELANLMIGSSDALGIDSDVYTSVDKMKLAGIVYEDVKNIQDKENTDILKNLILEKSVIEAYNEGKSDFLVRNNVQFLYPEILKLDSIEKGGFNFYSFYKDKLSDIDKSEIIKGMFGKDFKTAEDLQRCFAKVTFARAINACGATFGGDTSYFYDLLNKDVAEYIGIDLSGYFALGREKKALVHKYIGRSEADKGRTTEMIVEEINFSVNSI